MTVHYVLWDVRRLQSWPHREQAIARASGLRSRWTSGVLARSCLSELRIARSLSLNSLFLGLQKVFRLLHLTDQLFDFSDRCGADFLNKQHNLRVSFGQALRRRLCENEFARFRFRWPLGLQSPRHRFHAVRNIPQSPRLPRPHLRARSTLLAVASVAPQSIWHPPCEGGRGLFVRRYVPQADSLV